MRTSGPYTRRATPAETLRILRARLSEKLSPAEIRELERAAELLETNTRPKLFLEAARVARETLDNCTHPDCIDERVRHGFSNCPGGSLARAVVAAIVKASATLAPRRVKKSPA